MGKCVAQEEARKLILANIKSEQQDQVESTPHWPRTWEAGSQVMLQADCKGKGWSKKLSQKWTGPYAIVEVCSPQAVVLEEPNSRNWFTINVEQIKQFTAGAEEDLHANHLLEQFQASRSSATTGRVQNTVDSVQAGGGGESSGFPMKFQSTHSSNSSQKCIVLLSNKCQFTFFFPSLWVVLSRFQMD